MTASVAALAPNAPSATQPVAGKLAMAGVLAWLPCAIFYFYQYAVRSAPGVMQSELSTAWGGNHIGSIISAYYVVYAVMALVAGVLLDRYGARRTIPYGIAVVAVGCLLFAQGSYAAGMVGFVLQGMGAIFAFIGSSYVAARYLPSSMLALFIGLTQCLGMAGAAFGSKPVHMLIDPTGDFHLPWQQVWLGFSVLGVLLAVGTWWAMPAEGADSHHGELSLGNVLRPYGIVLSNPQSWLAGVIGGLLFAPTTIGALVWVTAFLHDGQHMAMSTAAADASMVPIGWVIGCPLLGYISDKIGRRKPVLIVGGLAILGLGLLAVFIPAGTFPRYSIALLFGIASGAAMIPFSSMKEVNPHEVKGTAAGVMNFLVFLTTGLLAPFISRLMSPAAGESMSLLDFQHAFVPLVIGVALAIVLSFFLRETGTAVAAQPNVKA